MWIVLLALWILVSGLDDLFISVIWCFTRKRPFPWPAESELHKLPERRIAVFVPLWREHAVIGRMLARNMPAIRYRNFELFVGVYPNDLLTQQVVLECARTQNHVHIAMVPDDGPSTKADCLNAIYQRMRSYELRHAVRFDAIVTHDAEDLIHPESLRLINWYLRDYQMVQVPVLPLAGGRFQLTRGLYCDEFAEFQSKDIPVRQRLGGFLPANGVGTGFLRDALERSAALRNGRLFDPGCLTEDYETGYRLFRMGCRQIFLPVRFENAGPVATREYFPKHLREAVRQRSRWVTGIALQSWQKHRWGTTRDQVYWFWRDRKGLLGNVLAPLTNLLFLSGLATPLLRLQTPGWFVIFYPAAAAITLIQIAVRIVTSARIYGPAFAALVPIRMFWGNVVNCAATLSALHQFGTARIRHQALAWRKTEHDYPVLQAAGDGQRS